MRGLCQVITDGKLWKPGTGHINKTKTYKMKKSFIAPYDIYEAISGRDRAVLLPGAVARSDVPPPHMQMVAGSILVSGKILSTW